MLLALTERLEHEGLIHSDGPHLKLTPEGERVALHVVRAHRLWEVYLAEELGMPLDRVHVEAERAGTSSEPADSSIACRRRWDIPDVDPHGDPIPERGRADSRSAAARR